MIVSNSVVAFFIFYTILLTILLGVFIYLIVKKPASSSEHYDEPYYTTLADPADVKKCMCSGMDHQYCVDPNQLKQLYAEGKLTEYTPGN